MLSAVWLSGTGYLTFLFNFGLNIVLARLLFPKDFGQFALAGSLVEILSLVAGFSFSQAVIQMQDAPGVVETAFVLSVRLYAALVLGAAALGALLRPHYPGPFIPLFVALFAVRNLSIIAYVYSALLERAFLYAQASMIRLISTVLSIGVALGLARAGAGVWSLLGREVVLSGVALAGAWGASGWRYRGGYHAGTAKRLWTFGWQMFVARALETIWYRADTALLGVLTGTVVLGYYDRGRYFAEFGHYFMSFAAVQVAFPVYARLQGRREALSYAYRLSHGLLVRLMLPLVIWLAVFPGELVGLLYGAGVRWVETAQILPWLAFYGFLFPVVENTKVLLTGIGQLTDAVRIRLVQVAVALPFLIPAIHVDGARGAAVVMGMSEIAGLWVAYTALRRHVIHLSLHSYARPVAAAAAAAGFVAAARGFHLLPWTGRVGYAANLGASASLYLVALLLIDRALLRELLGAVLSALRGDTPTVLSPVLNGVLPTIAPEPRDGSGHPLPAPAGEDPP